MVNRKKVNKPYGSMRFRKNNSSIAHDVAKSIYDYQVRHGYPSSITASTMELMRSLNDSTSPLTLALNNAYKAAESTNSPQKAYNVLWNITRHT